MMEPLVRDFSFLILFLILRLCIHFRPTPCARDGRIGARKSIHRKGGTVMEIPEQYRFCEWSSPSWVAEEEPSLEVSEQQEPKGYHQVVRGGSGRIINNSG